MTRFMIKYRILIFLICQPAVQKRIAENGEA
jgi:hypothetical protein